MPRKGSTMLEFDINITIGSFELHASGRQEEPQMGLYGPSGCGKTTLLNCLAGLLPPNKGYILLNGETIFDSEKKINVPAHKRAIGYVFQDGRLFPHMSVKENIEYGRHPDHAGPDLSELTNVFDLEDLLDRSPNTLSGGESQRVALARALTAAPQLLLLDEPLASIDTALKLRIMPYLTKAYEVWQIPFIYVSHLLSELLFLTVLTWEMTRGQVIRSVHADELLSSASRDGEHILNILGGVIEDVPENTGFMLVSCDGQNWKVPNNGMHTGENVSIAIPAGDLIISLKPPEGLSARNVLPARIQHLEQNGHTLWVVAASGSNRLVVELTEDAGRELGLQPGKSVYLIFKSHSINVTAMKEGQTNGR